MNEAVELVKRVCLSAERHAKLALDAVALAVSSGIIGVALRECPAWLPSTNAKKVSHSASEALGIEDFDAHFLQLRRSLGPPWDKDHMVAMAAAIVAAKADWPSNLSKGKF